jgi:uroporphyrinogen decarboxylase
VITAVRQVVADSPVPVVCFSGGPFTLASYLVEGRPTRDFKLVKAFMYQEPEAFESLLGKLTDTAIGYLTAQVRAGADAIQLFDSWIGALSADDYAARVLPHSRRLLSALAPLGVPRIHFGVNTGGLLELMAEAGPDVVGVDWHVPLDVAWSRVGAGFGVQGNLDPAALLAPPELLREQAHRVLRRAAGRPGHVFNLGHGVMPETPLDNLHALVETVHDWELPG